MARLKGSGKTLGSGRKRGTRNKATAEVRDAAQKYTKQALKTLSEIAKNGKNESARVAAACAILDRGHGRPTQPIGGDADGPPLAATVTVIIEAPAEGSDAA